MRRTGKLASWDEARGFGFIAPTDGGREVFVHISAFPRDGSIPTPGESLTFELGRGRDGRPAAVDVHRQAFGTPRDRSPQPRAGAPRRRRPSWPAFVSLAAIVVAASWGYTHYMGAADMRRLADPAPDQAKQPMPSETSYRCDGRTHCSQMTSCGEAKFFISHCPGTTMDGDNDGVPCEQQWCTGPLAR